MSERFETDVTNEYRVVFDGAFTLEHHENNGLAKNLIFRVEYSPQDQSGDNRITALQLYGHETLMPGETCSARLFPLSEHLMSDISLGDILKIKHGSLSIGVFLVHDVQKIPFEKLVISPL